MKRIERATIGSAGYDIKAPYDLTCIPFRKYTIDTGIRLGNETVKVRTWEPVEEGDDRGLGWNRDLTVGQWFMMVVPRSSLASKYGMHFIGIIDQDYRDTIRISFRVNRPLRIREGDRIAQGVIIPYGVMLDEVTPKQTRKGGFGSTGM